MITEFRCLCKFHADSAADSTDAVMPLNIDVQSYKKLHEKNLFNDLSSHGREDTYCQCPCDDTIRSEPSHFPVS